LIASANAFAPLTFGSATSASSQIAVIRGKWKNEVVLINLAEIKMRLEADSAVSQIENPVLDYFIMLLEIV